MRKRPGQTHLEQSNLPTSNEIIVSDDHGGQRLDLAIAAALDVSRTRAATLIATGNVVVNARKERASYHVTPGDVIRVEIPDPEVRDIVAESIPLDVVYEDEHVLVINKAAGMVVHPAPGNWTGTVVNALLGRGHGLSAGAAEDRPGIVHRLDKETSGLLIVAKSDIAHRKLGAAIAARRVSRRYAVMIWGHLAGDHLVVEKPVARDPNDRKRMAISPTGKSAKTEFFRLARFGSGDLLRAHLYTGRTHQIRVHLASTGHPVMGDDVYGGGGGRRLAGLPPKRHFLHAAWLAFRHPVTGEPLEFRAPLPNELQHALGTIAQDPDLAGDPDPLTTLGFYNTNVSVQLNPD